MKILVIGGGNMGTAYARSFLRAHVIKPEELMILEKSPEKAFQLRQEGLGTISANPEDCLPEADLVILAVKPQDFVSVSREMGPACRPEQIFLSIMAGVRIDLIAARLNTDKIVRAMPNLPSQISRGMTVFTSTRQVSREELLGVQNLLNTTGKTLYVEDENLLDAATAISGSGPAYVFYFMDALMEAARRMGFSDSEAELLSWQTFQGTVDLFRKRDFSCEEWIRLVSSKGGTTEAAIRKYSEEGIKEGIISGAMAAYERARELGEKKS